MKKILRTASIYLGAAAMAWLAMGCATQGRMAQKDIFFPAPPDEPRLQFLMAFCSEKGFREHEDRDLMSFLTGAKQPEKSLGKPYGAVAYDKKIFVCDTDLGAVVVADLQTQRLGILQAKGEGALKVPLNIAIDAADGTTYVADTGREQVVLFDKKGDYLATLGKKDEMKPRDVAVGKDRIYVADLQKHNVRVFDKTSRNFLFEIPRPEEATNHVSALYTAINLALDAEGRLYASDTGAGRVQVYDAEGKFIRSVGQMGDGLGMFARIKGVTVDRDNRLYAVDAMSQVVQIFNEQGKLLTYFGEPGDDRRIQNLPAKVLVDYEDVSFFQKHIAKDFQVEHLVIVINQIGPHKVSIYGFGHKK